MSTKVMVGLLPIMLCPIGNSECLPPIGSIETLRARLTYLNGRGSNFPHVERIGSVTVGTRSYLRLETIPTSNYAVRQRPVYIFEGSQSLAQINCPADGAWTACLVDWERSRLDNNPASQGEHRQLKDHRILSTSQVCNFTLDVQPWQPSPDNQLKRKTAAEVAAEVREFLVEGVRSIIVRDFNLDDPDINIYIVDLRGKDQVLGCYFDGRRSPHCSWHMFGQSPVESIIADILKMPYRLYPAPQPPGY